MGPYYKRLSSGGKAMKEEKIGFVFNYFSKISVAAIEITGGTLSVGDKKYKGVKSSFLTYYIHSAVKDFNHFQQMG